jgi:signal transduction histidine kinase
MKCVMGLFAGTTVSSVSSSSSRFKQTGARTTRGEKITGLGLSIVKQLVDLHGGQVQVSSVPGQGSVYTMLLPCSGTARWKNAEKAP